MDWLPNIVPIKIREDRVVQIYGIPHDLTPAEAERLAVVILAFADPTQPLDTTR